MKILIIFIIHATFSLAQGASPGSEKKDFWENYSPYCEYNSKKEIELEKKGTKDFDLSKDDLLAKLKGPLILTGEKKEFLCRIIAQDWTAKPRTTIALAVTQLVEKMPNGGKKQTDRCFWIGLFSGKDNTAKTKYCVSDDKENLSFDTFDFAPYRISETETALGMRFKHYVGLGGSGSGYDDYLFLFRPQGAEISLIFKARMKSFGTILADLGPDRMRVGPEKEVGDHRDSVIEILKNKTNGFNDLKKRRGKKKVIFKWNGSSYETQDKEFVKSLEE